ncbi:hypothetical protein [Aeromonas rivipollensis]|uniref:hypothetical protein n=1 Tax=Aeromonas rivipollensis TaxID=948519 RepID=UPI0039B8B3BC
MNERKSLERGTFVPHIVCVLAGLGIVEGQTFPIMSETGSVWEILLGGEYRKVNKRSCRVQGWKDGPRFGPVVGLVLERRQSK